MVTPELIKLAKISPKEYGQAIALRNKELLENLLILKEYVDIGEKIVDIPFEIRCLVTNFTSKSCPHCNPGYDCSNCLYKKVFGNIFLTGFQRTCTVVKFGIDDVCYSYSDLCSEYASIRPVYYYSDARICINYDKNICEVISKKDFDMCMIFLKGHIEWGELDCWGEEYMRSTGIFK